MFYLGDGPSVTIWPDLGVEFPRVLSKQGIERQMTGCRVCSIRALRFIQWYAGVSASVGSKGVIGIAESAYSMDAITKKAHHAR